MTTTKSRPTMEMVSASLHYTFFWGQNCVHRYRASIFRGNFFIHFCPWSWRIVELLRSFSKPHLSSVEPSWVLFDHLRPFRHFWILLDLCYETKLVTAAMQFLIFNYWKWKRSFRIVFSQKYCHKYKLVQDFCKNK